MKIKALYAMAPAIALAMAPLAAAEGTVNTATGVDEGRKCIYNGFHYTNPSNISPYNHCFNTEDKSTVPPLATTINKSKTKADLERVENTSPLDPKNYLAKDTFAYKKLTGKEPISPFSKEISRTTTEINLKQNVWMTGYNAGGFEGKQGVSGGENIPIFTVDSSNPYQHYVTVTSSDGRVTSNAKNVQMMTGKIPLPEWYKPSSSGDHSIAIYDVATGIYRSLYYFTQNTDSAGKPIKDSYNFDSGGYVYANPNFQGMNDRNYWMTLISGTSSVVGMTNELTQIGVEEIRNLKINHAISMTWEDYGKLPSFPAKQADGRVNKDDQPFVPQSGMRFTLPKDFDVDKYAKQNRIDPLTTAILHAVQEYGGFIADRNFFTNAFNLENPTGYAPYARQGKNVYLDDPQINAIISKFQSHRFPTEKLQWMPQNYLNDPSSTVKAMEYPVIDYTKTGNEAYQPDAVYSSVYQGQSAFERTGSAMQMSPNLMNNTYMYKTSATDGLSLLGEMVTPGGTFGMSKDDQGTFIPKSNFTGTTEAWYTNSFWLKANGVEGNVDPVGPITAHRPTENTNHNGRWVVNVVPKGAPIARSDDGWLVKNTAKSFSVTANDEASFGQDQRTAGSSSATVKGIKLLNAAGQEVSSYSDNYGTYSVDGKNIKVQAKGNVGYTPIVRYKAVTSDGRTSSTGYFQPLIASRTSTSSEIGGGSTPPKPPTPPTIPKPPVQSSNAPTVKDDSTTVASGGTTTLSPLSNDSLNGAFSWKSISLVNPSTGKSTTSLSTPQGTWSVSADKKVKFRGKAGYVGNATVKYTATSSNGKSATGRISVFSTGAPQSYRYIGKTTVRKSITFNPLAGSTTGNPNATWASLNMLDRYSRKVTTVKYSTGTFRVNKNKTITFTPSGKRGTITTPRYIATTSKGANVVRPITITVTR